MVLPLINCEVELEPVNNPIKLVLSGYLSVLELAQYKFEIVLLFMLNDAVVLLAW